MENKQKNKPSDVAYRLNGKTLLFVIPDK